RMNVLRAVPARLVSWFRAPTDDLHPRHQPLEHAGEDLFGAASDSGGNAEGVIPIGDELERRARAEPLDQRPQQSEVREIVTRSLQEEHRDAHVEEMPATLVRWTSGWMQRKPQEDETADSGQRRFGLR